MAEKISIEQLLSKKFPHDIEKVLGLLQAGTFGDCHTAIYEKTGTWISELVPVFERLDAMLAFRKAPA